MLARLLSCNSREEVFFEFRNEDEIRLDAYFYSRLFILALLIVWALVLFGVRSTAPIVVHGGKRCHAKGCSSTCSSTAERCARAWLGQSFLAGYAATCDEQRAFTDCRHETRSLACSCPAQQPMNKEKTTATEPTSELLSSALASSSSSTRGTEHLLLTYTLAEGVVGNIDREGGSLPVQGISAARRELVGLVLDGAEAKLERIAVAGGRLRRCAGSE